MSPSDQPSETNAGKSWLTLPNVLTLVRIICSPGLLVLALYQQPVWLGVLLLVLVLTEWLDGLLARLLHQESAVGARLDTVADAIFYTSALAAVIVFSPYLVRQEAAWIAAVGISYLMSWLVGWLKFRRLPSYHTWAAKGSWAVVAVGILCLLTQWSFWMFRISMICVVITNLEAIAISLVLAQSKVDVPTLWHALNGAGSVDRDSG